MGSDLRFSNLLEKYRKSDPTILGPSGVVEIRPDGSILASQDYLANYSYGVPGLILSPGAAGALKFRFYGPDRGIFGRGVPKRC
jgi:hypothetical protein